MHQQPKLFHYITNEFLSVSIMVQEYVTYQMTKLSITKTVLIVKRIQKRKMIQVIDQQVLFMTIKAYQNYAEAFKKKIKALLGQMVL
jgi:hypothetical protein